nr:hypothetical protein [Fodinicola feengrottensis]
MGAGDGFTCGPGGDDLAVHSAVQVKVASATMIDGSDRLATVSESRATPLGGSLIVTVHGMSASVTFWTLAPTPIWYEISPTEPGSLAVTESLTVCGGPAAAQPAASSKAVTTASDSRSRI